MGLESDPEGTDTLGCDNRGQSGAVVAATAVTAQAVAATLARVPAQVCRYVGEVVVF